MCDTNAERMKKREMYSLYLYKISTQHCIRIDSLQRTRNETEGILHVYDYNEITY